ncbi:MAG: DUF7088 domain-containing protein [Phycisphaeraceae bacterium]
MSETPPAAPSKTTARPRRRRVLFALNTLLSVSVALALVVLINWLAYRQFFRFDFTELGVYTLSPQTRQVLTDLEQEHEIVTLFDADAAPLGQRRVRDLIDEYERQSDAIDVTHLDPNLDIARYDAFASRLRERYADTIAAQQAAIDEARQTVRLLAEELDPVVGALRRTVEDETLPEGRTRQRLQQVLSVLRSLADGERILRDEVEPMLNQPLPDYAGVLEILNANLGNVNTRVLPTAIEWFEQAADDPAVPAEGQEALLRAVDTLESVREPVQRSAGALREAPTAEAYDRVRSQLQRGAAVIVMGPERVRVLGQRDLFVEIDPRIAEQADGPVGEIETRFLGEERLTGALASLRLDPPPMVVFVNAPQTRALGEGGSYRHVADRLRSMSFDVRQWSPSGVQMPGGGQSPAQPPPTPAEGQKAVWIVLPQPPPNPGDPMQQAGGGAERVAEVISQRLAAGDAAMVMLAVPTGVMVAAENPLARFASEWGILPQLDRLIVSEERVGETRTVALPRFEVTQWPDPTPITRSLAGMPGLFVAPAPLSLDPGEDVAVHPLVKVRGERMWTLQAENITSNRVVAEAEFDEEASEPSFIIAAAAQRTGATNDASSETGSGRLAVFADSYWATDAVTTRGRIAAMGLSGAGLVDQGGVPDHPANAELFVNTVYWLAELDDLIATSPRVQKSRRIPDIDREVRTYTLVAVVAGLPAFALFTGVVVYLVRRRG